MSARQDSPSDEADLRQAIENMPLPVMLLREDGSVEQANRLWRQLSGYDGAELHRLEDWAAHALPPDAEELRRGLLQIFQLQAPARLGESALRCRDGSRRHWEFRAAPLATARTQAPRRALLLAVDLTERHWAEESLRESEARLRSLFENSPDAIFVEDHQGRVLDVNPAGCRLHGYSREEILNMTVEDLVPKDKVNLAAEDFRKVASGEWDHLEGWSLTRDGREVPVEIRVAPIRYQDREAVLLQVRDITERRRVEEQIRRLNAELEQRVAQRTRELETANLELRELDRLKDAFVAVTSHEIRAPLTIVAGMLEILLRQDASAASETRYLELAAQAAERLRRIADRSLQVLASGRYDQGLELRQVDPRALVEKARDELEPFTRLRHQQLETELDPRLQPIQGDPDKLLDVLVNLGMNAVKFTPDGGSLRLEARRLEDDSTRLGLRDTGIGVPEADRPHLFKEFFTSMDVRHHSSGEYGFMQRGIGMGLAIVRRIVELHGGNVGLDSQAGQGSFFYFDLPDAAPTPAP